MNKLLNYLEQICLAGLIIGFVLQFIGNKFPLLFGIGLAGLAVTFFLRAFKPLDIDTSAEDPMGFKELLGFSILPKVLWIGMAIVTIGILFYTLQLDNNGYMIMLVNGGVTVLTATLILLVLKATGTKHINVLLPALYRAIPILLMAAYIIFG